MPGKKGATKAAKIGTRRAKNSKAAKSSPGKGSKKEAPKSRKGPKKDEEDLEKDLAAQSARSEVAVKRKTMANRLDEAQARGDKPEREPKGVVYLGHLPEGFYEPQMKKFFNQFGRVTKLKLCRSPKNAVSKGYAFIEFAEESVAKVVADTMNKYLLFGKVLVANLVPKEKQHTGLFKGTNRRFINFKPKRLREAISDYNDRPTVEVNGVKVPQTTLGQERRRNLQDQKLKKKLALLGVDFNLEAAMSGGADEEEEAPKAKAAAGKKRKAAAKTSAGSDAKKKKSQQ